MGFNANTKLEFIEAEKQQPKDCLLWNTAGSFSLCRFASTTRSMKALVLYALWKPFQDKIIHFD